MKRRKQDLELKYREVLRELSPIELANLLRTIHRSGEYIIRGSLVCLRSGIVLGSVTGYESEGYLMGRVDFTNEDKDLRRHHLILLDMIERSLD